MSGPADYSGERQRLLLERGRTMLLLIVGVIVLFAVADLFLGGEALGRLLAAKAVILGVCLLALAIRKRGWAASRCADLDLAAASVACGLTALQSAWIGDTVAFRYTPVVGSLFTAVFVPWGVGRQAAFALVCVSMTLFNAASVAPGYEHVAGVAASLMSIFVASRAERQRLADWRMRQALVSALERAERATRAKSTFLATMSHEMRTPLNAVIGMAELLLARGLPPEQRQAVETIREGADSLFALIGDILDFSKIEADELTIEERPFDIRASAQAAARLLAPAASGKGNRLDVRVSPNVPQQLIGDETRIRQILFNLLQNAVKFTEQGRVEAEIAWRDHGGDGGVLVGTVRDTGIGIPQERMAEIFEPFHQLDSSHTRRHGGAGLGLAICRRLCERMGGTITVESRPGQGSAFTFEVPVKIAAWQPDRAERPADGGPKPSARRRVLVAEDNPLNARVVQAMLRRLGHDVVVAGNGAAALDQLARGRFDVVLMDLEMPEMDGLAAAARIRERFGAQAPRIIAVTAHVTEEHRVACARAGMHGFLAKPVTLEALEEALAGGSVPPGGGSPWRGAPGGTAGA